MHRSLARLAAAGLAVSGLILGLTAAWAGTATGSPATPERTNATAGTATPGATPIEFADATGSQHTCAAVLSRLAYYRHEGLNHVPCLSLSQHIVDGPAVSVGQGPAVNAAPEVQATSLCGAASYLVRTENCLDGTLTLTVLDVMTGEVIGSADFDVEQLIELNWKATEFEETDYITMVGDDDIPAATVNLTSVCSAPCMQDGPSAFGGPEELTLGQTAEGEFIYEDVPAPGPDTMTLDYDTTAYLPGLPLPAPVSSVATSPVRCDNRIPGVPAGCVFSDLIPTLEIPVAQFGAAAVGIKFAQMNLPDHWGLPGHPLHILRNSVRADLNRRKICPDSQRYRFQLFPGDSCDEYPFAATYESGAMLTPPLTWRNCAEIWPSDATGIWISTPIRNYTGTQRCTRNHVPRTLNTATGIEYEIFGLQNRLLDLGTLATSDPFYVDVPIAAGLAEQARQGGTEAGQQAPSLTADREAIGPAAGRRR
jgi:hypothetical protein